jgi:hypothetical protein
MEEVPYSNREMDQFLKALDEKQEERHEVMTQRMDVFESNTSASLEEIKELQKKTNGRVRWTEKMIWLAIGGLGVITILMIPLLLALLQAGRL